MAEISLSALATEIEYLRMRVTALENALKDAEIVIPSTPVELLQMAQADGAEMRRKAERWE